MDTEVIVALIGMSGIMGAAVITAIGNRRYLKKNLGETNGHGTVADMGALLITAFEEHATLDTARFDAIHEDIKHLTKHVVTEGLANRLEALEAEGRGVTSPPAPGAVQEHAERLTAATAAVAENARNGGDDGTE